MRPLRPSIDNTLQYANAVLMIRPAAFSYNEQTAPSNAFQSTDGLLITETINAIAQREFDDVVKMLRKVEIDVMVIEDTILPTKPDAIFPNNWISFHENGKVVLYPMLAENRRLERRHDIIDAVKERFIVKEIVDLSVLEEKEQYLEGTGSMVLDRCYRIAYAVESPRTDINALKEFAQELDYEIVSFRAVDENDQPIYHTNVMMSVGKNFAVVCLEAISDPDERYNLRVILEETGKAVIPIYSDQMAEFAGNILCVNNLNGEQKIILSTRAMAALEQDQLIELKRFGELVPVEIPTIENFGGGSVRCMMAEIFLPRL